MELNALLYVQFGLRDAQMQEKEGGEAMTAVSSNGQSQVERESLPDWHNALFFHPSCRRVNINEAVVEDGFEEAAGFSLGGG